MKKLNQKGDAEMILLSLVVLFVVLIIGFFIFWGIYKSTHHARAQFTINKSERVCDGGKGSCKYLVYTDSGVFEDTDSIINHKYNSSDLYNQLKNNHTYDCDVTGFRIPFWSEYQNIISCTELKS